ncbi:hypothetical protein HK107_08920, partial [Parvularcula sp. ZS-1/3]
MIPILGEVTCLSIAADIATTGVVAGTIAKYRDICDRARRLDDETNEHIGRALLTAHYRSAREVFLLTREQHPPKRFSLHVGPPQPKLALRFIAEQYLLLSKELPRARLEALTAEWRSALDWALSDHDLDPHELSAGFGSRLADAARSQFDSDIEDWRRRDSLAAERAASLFTEPSGYLAYFRGALWQEFKSERRPEFRRAYGVILQRETKDGIAQLKVAHAQSTQAILDRIDGAEKFLGEKIDDLAAQGDTQHKELLARFRHQDALIEKLTNSLGDKDASPAAREDQAEAIEHIVTSDDKVDERASELLAEGAVDDGFDLLVARAEREMETAVQRYRDIADLAQFVRIKTAVLAMEKVCAGAPVFWDWVKLSRFLKIDGRLKDAEVAARKALAAAEDDRDRSVGNNELGDVRVAQGDLPGALSSYEAGLAIAEELAGRDAGNTEWQRDLSVSHNKIGDVRRAQGDLPGALSSYEAGLAIREELAGRDAGNTEWQRDLSVSHDRIGDVRRAQGDLPGALSSYEAGLAIAEELAGRDAGNTEWQRDLSVSHNKIGDVRRAQGDLPGALSSYEAGLAIAEELAGRDAGNT